MINRLPAWFAQEVPGAKALSQLAACATLGITTVCLEAHCPNLGSCFKNSQLTFMILGKACTRQCRFCAVMQSKGARGSLPDPDEPGRICRMVESLGLKYVVITSVTRDDLPDAGAGQFARTLEAIHALSRDIKVEVLLPDFAGNLRCLEIVLNAEPTVVGHNIETVEGLYQAIRSGADYRRSLAILRRAKELRPDLPTKSSLMVGLGETEAQVVQVLRDLRGHLCDAVTIGQYLAPSPRHYPVREFISIGQFERYRLTALGLGFKGVRCGPKVRSSYEAQALYKEYAYA